MWPFIRGERPRNRLLWRKSSCPPFLHPLLESPPPSFYFALCRTQMHLWTLERHPGKLEMCRGVTLRRKRRGDGNDRGTIRLNIGEEEEAKLGRREDATAFDDERTRKGTEWRNAVYALSVIGKGERPSMWRTCRCCCCCSLLERAGRSRSQSRRRRDSRHAKSPMTDVAVCERGFRAMEIGESLAKSVHLGFSSDFSRERPETWLPRLYSEVSPETWRELKAYLETLRLAIRLFKS